MIKSSVILGPIIKDVTEEKLKEEVESPFTGIGYYLKKIEDYMASIGVPRAKTYEFARRKYKVKKDRLVYTGNSHVVNNWHTDSYNDNETIIMVSLGIAPTEFLLGNLDIYRGNEEPCIPPKYEFPRIANCIKKNEYKVESYPNQIVFTNNKTYHRATLPQEDGYKIFFRICVKTDLLKNYKCDSLTTI